MNLLQLLLPLLLCFVLADSTELKLQQDLQKDLAKLQQSNSYFISDNTTSNPSVQGVASDLQLFALIANLDLSQAKFSQVQQGSHQVQQWEFKEGQIQRIVQVQSSIQLDTVVTQRYLENRAPTEHHVQNNFTFRTYFISTTSDQNKLYYLTEEDQGLLAYKLGEKEVEVGYSSVKEGLSDVLPQYKREAKQLITELLR